MGECLIIRSGGGTDTSNANATATQVLSGYTCYVKDTKITGTMTNRGTMNQSLNPGGSYTIPVGYHSGSGKVTVSSLSANTSGTANASRILSGRTAWVGGSRLTGTMTNRGAVSQTLAANGSYTIPAGWHNGSGKVSQSLTTQGAKSVTPKTTNQTACSANRWTTGTITIVGSSNLKAANIKNGVTIFGITGTWVGWVDPEMVMENLVVSKNNLHVGGYRWFDSPSNPTHYMIYTYNQGTYSMYGWNSISITLSNYIGPTSGGQDCAVSVWLLITDKSPQGDPIDDSADNFGEAGDIFGDWYCMGVLGYHSGMIVYSLSERTSNFPQYDIKRMFLWSWKTVPVGNVDSTNYFDYWFDGNATVIPSLTL